MKHVFIIIAICLSAFFLFGQRKQSFKSVDVKEFENYLRDTSYVVLDVRTPGEHAEGFIPGTDYNIDVLEDNFEFVALKTLPVDKSVALYCRSGNRSKTAAKILTAHGYNVVELASGYRGWVAAGNLAD